MCDDCYTDRQKRYQRDRQNDPVKIRKQREYRVIREYGVSMDEFENCMATSKVCQLCGSKSKKNRKLVYDHCHQTMKFRGVLCGSCNTAIGKLGDNIEGLQRAIQYLKGAK